MANSDVFDLNEQNYRIAGIRFQDEKVSRRRDRNGRKKSTSGTFNGHSWQRRS